jgi:hypothetical protein
MSYHMTNLGIQSHPYADVTGFVPEPGDKWEDFGFGGRGPSKAEWYDFIRRAQAYTARRVAEIQRRIAPG